MPQNQSKPVYVNGRKRITQKGFVKRLKLKATSEEIMLHGAMLHAFLPYRAVVAFQEPVGPYVADFYIYPFNLVLEVDGAPHFTPEGLKHDRRRNTFMKNKGITVIRIENKQVRENPSKVARTILAFCEKLHGPLLKHTDPPPVTKCPPSNRAPKAKLKMWP